VTRNDSFSPGENMRGLDYLFLHNDALYSVRPYNTHYSMLISLNPQQRFRAALLCPLLHHILPYYKILSLSKSKSKFHIIEERKSSRLSNACPSFYLPSCPMSILLPYDLFSYHPEFILRNTVVDSTTGMCSSRIKATCRGHI
jgi:hypothetical protein